MRRVGHFLKIGYRIGADSSLVLGCKVLLLRIEKNCEVTRSSWKSPHRHPQQPLVFSKSNLSHNKVQVDGWHSSQKKVISCFFCGVHIYFHIILRHTWGWALCHVCPNATTDSFGVTSAPRLLLHDQRRRVGGELGGELGCFLSHLSVVTGVPGDECGIHGMKYYPLYRDY